MDLSPIADLTKTEVFSLGAHLNVREEIQSAAPTDGLWGDDRTDEDQLGASYLELEWAMAWEDQHASEEDVKHGLEHELPGRQQEVLSIYRRFHGANLHKMQAIPVCRIPQEFKVSKG